MDSLLYGEKAALTRLPFFFLEGGDWSWWILALPSSSTAEARGEVIPVLGLGTVMGLPPIATSLVRYESFSMPEKDVRKWLVLSMKKIQVFLVLTSAMVKV